MISEKVEFEKKENKKEMIKKTIRDKQLHINQNILKEEDFDLFISNLKKSSNNWHYVIGDNKIYHESLNESDNSTIYKYYPLFELKDKTKQEILNSKYHTYISLAQDKDGNLFFFTTQIEQEKNIKQNVVFKITNEQKKKHQDFFDNLETIKQNTIKSYLNNVFSGF